MFIYIFSVFLQMFFYNVHMLPSDLFDKHISFRVSTQMSILKLHLLSICIDILTVSCSALLQVYNSYSLRADSLMGEFKVVWTQLLISKKVYFVA